MNTKKLGTYEIIGVDMEYARINANAKIINAIMQCSGNSYDIIINQNCLSTKIIEADVCRFINNSKYTVHFGVGERD